MYLRYIQVNHDHIKSNMPLKPGPINIQLLTDNDQDYQTDSPTT